MIDVVVCTVSVHRAVTTTTVTSNSGQVPPSLPRTSFGSTFTARLGATGDAHVTKPRLVECIPLLNVDFGGRVARSSRHLPLAHDVASRQDVLVSSATTHVGHRQPNTSPTIRLVRPPQFELCRPSVQTPTNPSASPTPPPLLHLLVHHHLSHRALSPYPHQIEGGSRQGEREGDCPGGSDWADTEWREGRGR